MRTEDDRPLLPGRDLLFVPTVVTDVAGRPTSMDLNSALFQKRQVFLRDPVDERSVSLLSDQLWWLDYEMTKQKVDPDSRITLTINTPGGNVVDGEALYDIIHQLKHKVDVTVVGMAASMGAVLLAGATGTRRVTPHSKVMIHQLSGSDFGKYTELVEALGLKSTLEAEIEDIVTQGTGQPADIVKSWFQAPQNRWLTANEAVRWGLADEVIELTNDGVPVTGALGSPTMVEMVPRERDIDTIPQAPPRGTPPQAPAATTAAKHVAAAHAQSQALESVSALSAGTQATASTHQSERNHVRSARRITVATKATRRPPIAASASHTTPRHAQAAMHREGQAQRGVVV